MSETDKLKDSSIMTIKDLQNKLLQWESNDEPLAPLYDIQKEIISDLEALTNDKTYSRETKPEVRPSEYTSDGSAVNIPLMGSTIKFLEWCNDLNMSTLRLKDSQYESYYKQLEERKKECISLTQQIGTTLDDLKQLNHEYELVSNKTNALHMVSEQLLSDQKKLSSISDDIKSKIHYFSQVEHITQRLNSTTMSVNSEAFFTLLSKIDECLNYMKAHPYYKEANVYQIKYRHCLTRAISQIQSYVLHILNQATEQILTPQSDGSTSGSLDTAFAVYFGKFQSAAPKLRSVIIEVEKRADSSEEYANLLQEIQYEYAKRRGRVAGEAASTALRSATSKRSVDICTTLRSAISLLSHAARDEYALHAHFFSHPSAALDDYLTNMCNGLYETMRPLVIHINHLETLAEICCILRVELLEEQVQNEPEILAALGRAGSALLQDCQERLVFRAHVYLRSEVLHYKPASGDLTYPDKLILMEQIAMSIQEGQMKRSDSRNSLTSDVSTTSQEVASINSEAHKRPQGSPADLHGMWYVGVRRTLATLSRLYRCLERRVFQGLAQEAISLCVTSVHNAHLQIANDKTHIDGELFEIKHLLILREQIAPFQVDFIVKETSLDFSGMKNAAYGLIQNRRQLFSLNSNNALLEFLLEGTPTVREHLLDSKKEVDRQLKSCCESFIRHASEILSGQLITFIEKTQTVTPIEAVRQQSWGTPEQIGAIVTDTQRRIKQQLAPIQRSMQLYLANKETEFILFRPIRNNVVGYFVQLEQFLTNAGYTYEDKLIVSCPTPEQISVLISSASLLSIQENVMPYGQTKRKTSLVHRPSVASIDEKTEDVNIK